MFVRALRLGEADAVLRDGLPLTASPAWLKAFPGKLAVYGVFDGEDLQAALVLQEKHKLLTRIVSDAALSPHCGLTFREYSGNVEKCNSWRKRVMAAIADHLDPSHWGISSVTFPDWVADFQPFVWRGFKVVVRYTYQIHLNGKTDEALLAEMSSNRRNEIRNGHKKGLAVSLCDDRTVIERLVAKSLGRQGVESALSNAHALLNGFAQPNNSFAYVTHKDGVPVAVCFCVHDAERTYYVLGGVDDDCGVAAAAPMAMFACIRHARELGQGVYDFEGSIVPGIEQYFRSFGGTLTPMYRVVKASLPIEMVLKPFKRALF
jgi:hypothetical protein